MILKLQEDNMVIQKVFHQHYSNLYKGHDIPLEKTDEYLKKVKVDNTEKQRHYE